MFYLFHGDDTHSQKEMLAKLKAKLGDPSLLDLNTTRFDKVVPLSELQHACDAVPFLAPARLVIAQDWFGPKADKNGLTSLLDYLPNVPKSTRLVFLESVTLPAKHPLVKLAETTENGYVKQFHQPEGSQLERWIRKRVEDKNGQISSHAAHVLAANVGSQLDILDNEIEKLVLYTGENEITVDIIGRLSPYAAEASIFDLVDALGNRVGPRAAALLQQKLGEGTDPAYLFAMIIRQIRLLIQVKELAETGEKPPAISPLLKIHNFVAGKLYQQSHHFSLQQLEKIYRHLLDIDVGVKTGKNDLTTALYLLVAGLTESV